MAWGAIPDLPRAAAAALSAGFARATSAVLRVQRSACGDTTKLLIRLQDGMQVEAVVMDYDTTERYAEAAAGAGAEPAAEAAAGAAAEATAGAAADAAAGAGSGPPSTSGRGGGGGGGGERVRGHKRGTLCVSSQVGCQMGCTFCATGTMGLRGNLTAGEIIEQLVHALRHVPVRNVVFMVRRGGAVAARRARPARALREQSRPRAIGGRRGPLPQAHAARAAHAPPNPRLYAQGMGEPLQNYAAVTSAVAAMTDPRLFGLARRHVTVSTVGVAARIRDMARDLPVGAGAGAGAGAWRAAAARAAPVRRRRARPANPPRPPRPQGVSLALSLHAPDQALRASIVPSARACPLDRLMAAVDDYQAATRQRVFVEYVLLAGAAGAGFALRRAAG